MRHINHIPLGLSVPINHTHINRGQTMQLEIIVFIPSSHVASIDFISNLIGKEWRLTDVRGVITILGELNKIFFDSVIQCRGRPQSHPVTQRVLKGGLRVSRLGVNERGVKDE